MIKIQDILLQLPDCIFWKDKYFNYLGANENLIQSAGLNSFDEILGKNDYQLPWDCFAKKYRSDDERVLFNREKLSFVEYHKDISGKLMLAEVNKKPLYTEDGSVAGVIGIYSKRLLTKNEEACVRLPRRQKEILIALAEGLTVKEIAYQFKLSRRTVEHYFDILKLKLLCNSKIELMKCALQYQSMLARSQMCYDG